MESGTIGVVGLGLLGRGIAACLLSHGFRVIAFDRNGEARVEARRRIVGAIDELVRRGGFPASLRDDWEGRYIEADAVEALAPCDFVVESIVEEPEAKRALFGEIETVVGPAVPIASNTSALPISQLQEGLRRPGRLVGMHWAEPCHVTRFLEIVRGERTDDATADAAMDLARRAGKDPSLVRKDVEGFIVNRIGYAMYREAFWLLENGVADVETIDRSFRNALSVWANVAGPFRWMDLTGIPAYAAVMERLWPKLSRAVEVPEIMKALVREGAKGISNGKGFYTYTPEEAERWERRLIENVWASGAASVEAEQSDHPQPRRSGVSDRERRLIDLGYPIDRTTPEGALVDAVSVVGTTVYASGQVPFDGDRLVSRGKVPSQIDADDATRAAALCAANVLRAVRKHVGSLDAVERVTRITGYVNSDPDFTDQHLVINGASQLVRDVFGEAGRHARTALGLAQLPLGASVEVEMILELKR